MNKHWTYFLPDGPGGRYLRYLLEQRNALDENLQKAIADVERLKTELTLEEDRITASILNEWSEDEIMEARAKAKSQTPKAEH